jgi:3-oxoacyl-[acyl-carrier-protein] synthase III
MFRSSDETLAPAPAIARRRRSKTRTRYAGILGTGFHVPETVLSNSALEEIVDTSDEWIHTRTGMRERRIAHRDEATSDLAAAAARNALADAGMAPSEVDLILVATATADHVCPSTAALVQYKIGSCNAAGFDIGAACSGFVNALMTGQQFIVSGAYDHVLVIGADKLSSITNYKDRDSCILFGDGAGAVVLGANGGSELLAHDLGLDGSGADLISVPAGGSARPASDQTIADRQHFLTLDGREVFRFAVTKFCEEVKKVADLAGFTVSDVDWIVPHQANQRILEAAARKLRFPMEKVVSNVERYGNTSSASIPIALAEAARDGRIKKGDLVAFVAFGGGLTWGASLLRW